MEKLIVVSDFDGTITKKDSLYWFFKEYALPEWLEVERLWCENKIGSKECLMKEFELIPDLSEELVDSYTDTIELDPYFKDFNDFRLKCGLDFVIVSDGVDYFINKILQKNNIKNLKIFSNHGEFIKGKFHLTFFHDNPSCTNNSGTCKCRVLEDLKLKYEKILYIGDGISDFCCADKADILFAKSHLLEYSREKNINCIKYNSFKEVMEHDYIN